jgi:hypothetical protein
MCRLLLDYHRWRPATSACGSFALPDALTSAPSTHGVIVCRRVPACVLCPSLSLCISERLAPLCEVLLVPPCKLSVFCLMKMSSGGLSPPVAPFKKKDCSYLFASVQFSSIQTEDSSCLFSCHETGQHNFNSRLLMVLIFPSRIN